MFGMKFQQLVPEFVWFSSEFKISLDSYTAMMYGDHSAAGIMFKKPLHLPRPRHFLGNWKLWEL